MKKLLFLIVFLPVVFGCEIIWDNGPTQLLKDIFDITKIKNANTLEKAIKISNSKWIRPGFLERWHAYSVLDNGQRKELMELVRQSDLAKVKLPKLKHYDVVVILGAAECRVQLRIDFLIKLYNEGVTFDKIYLLGSTRPLKEGPDGDKMLVPILQAKNLEADEMAMVEYLWQQTAKPEALKLIPVTSFKANKKRDGARAGLKETLTVMTDNTEVARGKSFLLISNNPYICFHDAIAKNVLKQYEIIVETVGAAMIDDTVENVLDSVARCLLNIK